MVCFLMITIKKLKNMRKTKKSDRKKEKDSGIEKGGDDFYGRSSLRCFYGN